jgi:hypothetical protein
MHPFVTVGAWRAGSFECRDSSRGVREHLARVREHLARVRKHLAGAGNISRGPGTSREGQGTSRGGQGTSRGGPGTSREGPGTSREGPGTSRGPQSRIRVNREPKTRCSTNSSSTKGARPCLGKRGYALHCGHSCTADVYSKRAGGFPAACAATPASSASSSLLGRRERYERRALKASGLGKSRRRAGKISRRGPFGHFAESEALMS